MFRFLREDLDISEVWQRLGVTECMAEELGSYFCVQDVELLDLTEQTVVLTSQKESFRYCLGTGEIGTLIALPGKVSHLITVSLLQRGNFDNQRLLLRAAVNFFHRN